MITGYETTRSTGLQDRHDAGDDYGRVGHRREGRVARSIESRTSELPSDLFLWAAGASIATSLTLRMMGRKEDAIFVGQWAPTLLVLGTYNKLVKLLGSD